MDFVLRIHPDLWKLLWDIGGNGVSDIDFYKILEKLPQEYKNLVSNEFINDVIPINSLCIYEKIIQNRGYYYKNQSIFFSSKIIRLIFTIIFRFKNFLNF